MHRGWLLVLALPLAVLACKKDGTGEPEGTNADSYLWLHPEVGGVGTTLDVEMRSERSQFVFGETGLDLGEGITVDSVTVMDGYTAVATVHIDPDAPLGRRDAVIDIKGTPHTLDDAFTVIEESFVIDPDNGKMGEMVDVAIVGTATEWEQGYTWAGFGNGIDVVEFSVLSETLATATLAIHPDAEPGPRDVQMEAGPQVVTLYDGFTVDRAVITAFFDPAQGYQGDTIAFTITGLDTSFTTNPVVQFWDDGGHNADIQVTELTVLDSENMYGRIRLSNAARIGMRDIYIASSDEAILIPDGFEVLDALPDLDNVAIGLGFDVIRQIDNDDGTLYEGVSAYCYFVIPLDPPCGSPPPPASGPMPYDINGVFPSPPEPEEEDCPNPETVSAGDYVWFESDENVVTLHKDFISSTGQIIYRGQDLTLDDYRFGQHYDLHTQGDPEGIPEVVLEGVQPTVPADYYLLTPDLWGDYTQSRSETFDYTWTPAMTYPTAIFFTQISGSLVETGEGGFAGSVPWDDGVHSYTPSQLTELNPGTVTFFAVSYIEGPYFGLPFSTIQDNQSDSALQTSATMILE